MEKGQISYDKLSNLFHWGESRIDLTEQLKDFVTETFNIKDLEEKSVEIQSKERKSFPIYVLPSKIDANIQNVLERSSDLEFSKTDFIRVKYSFGMSYWDLFRLRNGRIGLIVDGVVFPKNIKGLKFIIDIANKNHVKLIPSGGRTSVTEAIEPMLEDVVFLAVNLRKMEKILNFLPEANLISVESGILLPKLEEWLNERNFKFGHSPQSFMYTTIGGAIGARGAGQFSSSYGNIKNLIHDITIETPMGTITDRKTIVPESAVGSNFTDLIIGSEGALGFISKAYLRIKPIQPLVFSSFLFKTFEEGIKAIKTFYQLGIKPSIVRLSDKEETRLFLKVSSNTEEAMIDKIFKGAATFYLKRKGFSTDHKCLLVLIFDGEKVVSKSQMKIVSSICKKHQGISLGSNPAKSWYEDRYKLPFYRSNFMSLGILIDTLETAATWDKLIALYNEVTTELKKLCKIVMAHVSHLYKEGAAIYFTFLTEEDDNWNDPLIMRIRNSILPIFIKNGATLSHHHGIGTAFKKFLHLEKDDNVLEVFKAIKKSIDPNDILNPSSGILR